MNHDWVGGIVSLTAVPIDGRDGANSLSNVSIVYESSLWSLEMVSANAKYCRALISSVHKVPETELALP